MAEYPLPEPDEIILGDELRPAPYKLPPAFFTDPFTASEESGDHGFRDEHFAPALDGDSDFQLAEDLEAPALATQIELIRSDEPEPQNVKDKLARLVSDFAEDEHDRRERNFAGADVAGPSLGERLKARRRARRSVPETVPAAVAVAAGAPFQRLLTPLSGPALHRLQQEVAGDELLFAKLEQERKATLRDNGSALAFALVMLILWAVVAGRGYLDHRLVTAQQPAFLSRNLSHDTAGAFLFVLGLLLPLFSIRALADIWAYGIRVFQRRSLTDLSLAIGAACFTGGVLILLKHAFPLQAAAVLAGWYLTRLVVHLVRGKGA
jgi:hypothetical protein